MLFIGILDDCHEGIGQDRNKNGDDKEVTNEEE
jgi:hypothetical protein